MTPRSLFLLALLACPLDADTATTSPSAPPRAPIAEGAFLPAFPGAEGFGAVASGGRGGRVIAVTNLDDSGPGSLRAAIDAEGPRTVVFRISGNIPLRSNLKLRRGDLTIAGQTAPGDGICLQNYALSLDGASNVIIRHIRVRPGNVSGRDLDAVGGRSGENIIIDHCSMSWSIDECVSIYGGARNVTVQWCLVGESLHQSNHVKGHHGFGGIWGGQNASWHHNLLAHHSSRNPRIPGKCVDQVIDVRNNVIYNWGYNSTYGGDGEVLLNLVNNVYKPGPATRSGVRSRVANPSAGSEPNNWWISGNVVVGSPEVTADNWLGVHPSGGATPESLRSGAPFPVAPVRTQTAEAAFESVLEQAGAILPRRDPVDTRIVEETRTGTARFGETYEGGGKGIIDSQEAVGGWPELRSTTAPADTDGDGMPDEWELRYSLDPKNPADGAQDLDGDGYTNLEEYLNDTDPGVHIDYTVRPVELSAVVRTDYYAWRSVPIGGGGFVSGVVFHPTEPDLFYARTDVGGAYRWHAGEKIWIPLNDDLGRDDSQLTGVVSLALDPNDPDRVYLACGQYLPSWGRLGAILRSDDRGATWRRTEMPIRFGGNADGRSTGERLVVHPHDGRVLWLGTHQDGLWRSNDRGATWSRVEAFAPDQVTLVAIDRRGGGDAAATVWVGTADGAQRLWRSTDGGESWQGVSGLPTDYVPHHADFDYRDPAGVRLYVAGGNGLGPNGVSNGSVWKVDAETATPSRLAPPGGKGGFAGVSVDQTRAGVLLVSTLNRWDPGDEIFRSTDAGATWRPLLADATFERSAGPWSVASTPHWTGDVDIDPTNPDRAIFVTGYGLWATENLTAADSGGKLAWTFLNRGLDETVPLEVVSAFSGAPLVAAYGDIGVFRHRNLDVAPGPEDRASPHMGTAPSVAVAALAPEVRARTHYGATRGSYSLDGGDSWTDFANAPPEAATGNPGRLAVTADGGRFIWIPGVAGAYVSADRGASWTAATGAPRGSFRPAADAVDANHVYIYDGYAGRLAVSADGGASYTLGATRLPSTRLPAGGGEARAVPGRAGHVWVSAGAGGLYSSDNYGETFARVGGLDEAWRAGFGAPLAPGDHPAVYVWGRRGRTEGIWRSGDAGATWVRINDDARQFGWINDLTGDWQTPGRVYLATSGRGVVVGEATTTGAAGTAAPSHEGGSGRRGPAGSRFRR